MKRALSDSIQGALAGVVAAACMTPLRMLARRARLVRKTVPQAVEESLAYRLTKRAPVVPPELHAAADLALHLGYGASLGALYGLVPRSKEPALLTRGALLGLSTWALGAAVLLPLLGAARPLWRARGSEIAVNGSAHLIFGLVTAMLVDQLGRERTRRPAPDFIRRHLDIG